PVVREILAAVRSEGDAAVLRYAQKFDKRRPDPLFHSRYDGEGALARLPDKARNAMKRAADRIRAFHEKQLAHFMRSTTFRYTDDDGVTLGWRARPMARAGVYAPGGKARNPSSVLMSAIPARGAGAPEIV